MTNNMKLWFKRIFGPLLLCAAAVATVFLILFIALWDGLGGFSDEFSSRCRREFREFRPKFAAAFYRAWRGEIWPPVDPDPQLLETE